MSSGDRVECGFVIFVNVALFDDPRGIVVGKEI